MGIKEDYGTRALRLHNELRSKHGADPLVWSLELYQSATNYAIRMANRKLGDRLEPNRNVSWGQNLFEFRSRGIKRNEAEIVEKAINLWYSEGSSELPTAEKTRRNFSQIIWQDTQRLGVGVATNLEGTLTVVCAFYDPPGNFREEYADNIYPAQTEYASTVGSGRSSVRSSMSPSPRASPARSVTPGQRSRQNSGSNCNVHGDRDNRIRQRSEPRESPPRVVRASPQRTSPPRQLPHNNSSNYGNGSGSYGDRSTSVLNGTNTNSRPHVPDLHTVRASFTNPPEEATTGLKLMNHVRAKHGAPSLKLDQQLCTEARRDAEALAKNQQRPKEGERDLGRSLCTLSGVSNAKEAVERAVNSWSEQKDGYNFSDPLSSAPRSNVWSQMVWKGTKEVGVGVAKDGETWGVAALFTPPGNAKSNSEHLKNVAPTAY